MEGLRKNENCMFIISTHLYEIGESLKRHATIQFHYFETSISEGELCFSYQLKPGISNDRLGYLILQKEGVLDLLNKL
jgi:DNA mismatch repair ATPase MutS